MGMYDYFICDTSCPVCGNYIIEPYQTKDFERLLDSYKPGDTVCVEGPIHVYTHCRHHIDIEKFEENMFFVNNTAIWIEYEIPIIDGKIAMDQNQWKLLEVKEVDFNGLTFIPDGMTKEEVVLHYVRFNHKMKHDIEVMSVEKKKWE